jgi:transketolase
MTDQRQSLDQLCVNTIRMLSVDMIEKANSGHPGLPLGAASMAYVLWNRILRHNPENPSWCNRDRFVLSAGHGSALLYSLLHLTGYDLPMDELKQFRQWESKTPGHPEYGHTPGVESTTGPLGQGIAMAVGMAMAERLLAERFNLSGASLVDHCTYTLVSDGDLMEGVAAEAVSVAGFQKLGKLICLYDDNHITIDGGTDVSFSEDVAARFIACGWDVQKLETDQDLDRIETAILDAQKVGDRPSLIMVRTHIGFGSPLQDSSKAHGAPLGPENLQKTRETLGWSWDEPFFVPEEARDHLRMAVITGQGLEAEWQETMKSYSEANPEKAAAFQRQLDGELPADWDKTVPVFTGEDSPVATRVASKKVLSALGGVVESLVGGCADLGGSVGTRVDSMEQDGRYIHFGIREHGMGAIVNGMALHGGVIPFGSTFLVFSDYMRPSLRLAALMGIHSLFIFSHDSIGVGEDGPTHQPVDQLPSLRAIPDLTVLRPADANETAAAWRLALSRKKPTVLVLTRQKLPVLPLDQYPVAQGVEKGAYILKDCSGTPQAVLIASGSEVCLALEARERLADEGIQARVVSMPSWDLFEAQSQEYRDTVLPPDCRVRLAMEAASPQGWHRWAGDRGDVLCVDRFGASAPGGVMMEKFGFHVDNVLEKVKALLKG